MDGILASLDGVQIPFPIMVIILICLFVLIGWFLTLLEKYVFSSLVLFAYLWLGAFAVLSAMWFVSTFLEQYSDLLADGALSQSPVQTLMVTFDQGTQDLAEWAGAPALGFVNGVGGYTNIALASVCLGGLFLTMWAVLMLPLIDLVFNLKSTAETVHKESYEKMEAIMEDWQEFQVEQRIRQLETKLAQLEQLQAAATGQQTPFRSTGLKLPGTRLRTKG